MSLNSSDLSSILREVEKVFGRETLESRKVALFLSHRLSGLPLEEIGRFFGMGPSGVSQNTRRVEVLLKGDKKLIKEVERLKEILSEYVGLTPQPITLRERQGQ